MLATAIALLLPLPTIPLDTISLERAKALDSKIVTATTLVAKHMYMLGGKAVVGRPDHHVGVERGIVLHGQRYDVDEMAQIKV